MIRYSDNGKRAHLYDGTERVVRAGDKIRTVQYPGGLLPPAEPTVGVAVKFPHSEVALRSIEAFNASEGYIALDPDELVCESVYRPGTEYERIRYVGIHHVEPA